ncbi:transglutaminase-like cysteine peptidase [Sphingopyxis sp.]|uniref:transglutaminase-like cysteine peptidase n=1 Tax=Sphingopyxis sp. TaxID=1908224 RepID=UPI0035B1240C
MLSSATPAAAQASAGGDAAREQNGKPVWFGAIECRKVSGQLPGRAAPAETAAPATPSALDLMRLRQEGKLPAPFPKDGDRVIVPAGAAGIDPPPPARCASTFSVPDIDPDAELGTLAIPVDHTSFDARWNRVRRAAPARLMTAGLQRAGVTRDLDETAVVERINLWVNRHIAYAGDDRTYSRDDFWATAAETIARGTGDCEDFAILKMQLLRAAGIGGDRVKLMLLRDLAVNADHALLLVRSRTGWVALDNMTDRIYDGSRPNAMRPILSFSGARRWVHGYRDAPPVPVVAALPATAKAVSPTRADRPPAPDVRLASKSERDGAEIAGLEADRPIAANYRLALAGRAVTLDPRR